MKVAPGNRTVWPMGRKKTGSSNPSISVIGFLGGPFD